MTVGASLSFQFLVFRFFCCIFCCFFVLFFPFRCVTCHPFLMFLK